MESTSSGLATGGLRSSNSRLCSIMKLLLCVESLGKAAIVSHHCSLDSEFILSFPDIHTKPVLATPIVGALHDNYYRHNYCSYVVIIQDGIYTYHASKLNSYRTGLVGVSQWTMDHSRGDDKVMTQSIEC